VYVPAQAEAVNVAELPKHIAAPPPVIVRAVGIEFTVIVIPFDAGLIQLVFIVFIQVAV
jgi:hypothetical protein